MEQYGSLVVRLDPNPLVYISWVQSIHGLPSVILHLHAILWPSISALKGPADQSNGAVSVASL